MTALPTRRRVVLSYGMGADSTALLLRWIHEPATRLCDLADLLVVTAMTGDEWPVTGHLVTRHLLPLLREHGIRWVQVARAGAAQADGITVLDDSRSPPASSSTATGSCQTRCSRPAPSRRSPGAASAQ